MHFAFVTSTTRCDYSKGHKRYLLQGRAFRMDNMFYERHSLEASSTV